MINVLFLFEEDEIIIPCYSTDKFIDIINKFCKIVNIDLKDLYFSYNGFYLKKETELILNEFPNPLYKDLKYLIIFVNRHKYISIYEDQIKISKNLLCPICKQNIEIIIKNSLYRNLVLYECKNNHQINNFSKDEFEKNYFTTLEYCDTCKKSQIFNNKIYTCENCKIKLCQKCKLNHEQDHVFTNYYDGTEITLKYKIDKTKNEIKIFGLDFEMENVEKCRMIIEGKEYIIKDYFNLEKLKEKKDILEIKLKGVNNIERITNMFNGCNSLIFVSDFDTSNIRDMSGVFSNCSSLEILPDISKWDTSNVYSMKKMFDECYNLHSIPDISKWNVSKVRDMEKMFNECRNLSTLPDISNWDTFNVNNMEKMFEGCVFLSGIQ